jgi:PrgI family protein
MTRPVRIPADVNRPDRVLGPLTARQVVLLAVPISALYVAWTALRGLVPLPVFAAIGLPVAALAAAVALGHRDGLPLDRFLLAALHHHVRCRLHPHPVDRVLDPAGSPASPPTSSWAPADARPTRAAHRGTGHERRVSPGPLATATTASLGRDPTGAGVLDLGPDGLVAIAALSTINLGLRTPTEQDALAAGFARYLHTITGRVQFLIRTVPLDLRGHLQTLREQAHALPHPALVAAAHAHRAHLAALTRPPSNAPTGNDGGDVGDGGDGRPGLLGRQTLLILREQHRPGAEQRLRRQLEDAVGFLAPLDIAVVPLSPEQITTLTTDCWTPPRAALARSPRDATASAPGQSPGQPPEHDPWRQDSSTEVDPWAQLPAYPSDEMRPGISDGRGRPAVDFSLLDDQVLDRDPSPGAPALDRALVADELGVDGDVTVEGDLGDDEAGWWGR